MWIIPKAAGSHPWPLWSILKESKWFLLTRNNAGLIVDKPYRIILKTGRNEGWLVAVGKEQEIMRAWKYVEEQIASNISSVLSRADTIEYALGKFRSLATDEQLHMLPPEAQSQSITPNELVDVNMDGDEFDARFYFESGDITIVQRDLTELAREEPFFASNQLATSNMATPSSTIPKALDIPASETLVGLYACSLWSSGTVPRLGHLYLTPNFVGYYSGAVLLFSSLPLTLRYTDIMHMQYFVQTGLEIIEIISKKDPWKSSSATVTTPKSARSSISGFYTIAFKVISGGTQVFEEMNKLWKLSMKKFQASESDKKRIREGDKKDEYLVTYEEAKKAQSENESESLLGSNSTARGTATSGKNKKPDVVQMARRGLESLSPKVTKMFRLPEGELLLTQARASVTVYAKRGKSFVKSSNDVASVEGVMCLTTHFLLFLDLEQYKACPLGRQSTGTSSKSSSLAFQQANELTEDNTTILTDDAQSANVLLAEWDVAAAEQEDGQMMDDELRQRQAQLIKQAKKKVPSTSLATAEDAPIRLWFLIPLREVSRIKVGKPSATVSTAYGEFGVTPHIVNVHLPYNMYSFTFINRPNIFACMSKVHARVLRQESRRVPLATYSLDLLTTNPPTPVPASPAAESSSSKSSSSSFAVTPAITIDSGSETSSKQRVDPSPGASPASMPDSFAHPLQHSSQQQAHRDQSGALRPPNLGAIYKPHSASEISISSSPPSLASFASSSSNLVDQPSSTPTSGSSSSSQALPRSIFFTHVTEHPLSSGDAKFPDSIVQDSMQFASTSRARERLQEEKFLTYFHRYGQCVGFARKGPELPVLVRNGIPHNLRGHLWFTLSGACNRMMTSTKGYYQQLLETHAGKASMAVEQIERDLHRSMPSHPFYSIIPPTPNANQDPSSSEQATGSPPSSVPDYQPCKGNEFYHPLNPPVNEPVGISRLRRVLVTYSWHNPVIGYCQSMNIVVAMLLLYMSEEEAFFTLITLVEYLEEYWTREMMGAIVDMLVLKDLLRQKRPALGAHLDSLALDYSIVALPWFMCLFIGYVPHQLALRLMDCFFYNAGHGRASSTLFQAAIALFTIAENELMESFDPINVSTVLRAAPYEFDCDKLISLVFSDDALSLRTSIIDELRNYHRYNAIQKIEAQNMEEEFMVLVYGKKAPLILPTSPTSSPADSANTTEAQSSSPKHSNPTTPNPQQHPAPPPTTPTHFPLPDLKRLYLDFKDQVFASPASPTQNDSSKEGVQDLARIINTKGVLSTLTLNAFLDLFKRHFAWWPSSASALIPRLFKWMDISGTGRLSFVEYVQGIDVLCFGSPQALTSLFFDLLLPTPTAPGIDQTSFATAVRIIYYTLLYSKALASEEATDLPAPTDASSSALRNSTGMKPIPKRKKLNLEDVDATDAFDDDWLLLNADEKFDEVLAPAMLDTVFASYAEGNLIDRERFSLSVLNQLTLVPPSTINDV